MSVTRTGDWWSRGPAALVGNKADITATDISPASLTSESLSTNALTRSVVAATADTAKGVSLSSAYGVWQPSVPVTVTAAALFAMTSWFAATSESNIVTLWGGAAQLAQATLGTVSPASGERFSLGTITNAAVPAGTQVSLQVAVGTCSNAPAHNLQLDYLTTG